MTITDQIQIFSLTNYVRSANIGRSKSKQSEEKKSIKVL